MCEQFLNCKPTAAPCGRLPWILTPVGTLHACSMHAPCMPCSRHELEGVRWLATAWFLGTAASDDQTADACSNMLLADTAVNGPGSSGPGAPTSATSVTSARGQLKRDGFYHQRTKGHMLSLFVRHLSRTQCGTQMGARRVRRSASWSASG